MLPIRHGRFQMTLDPDHEGATMGQLGGVLDTEELVPVPPWFDARLGKPVS